MILLNSKNGVWLFTQVDLIGGLIDYFEQKLFLKRTLKYTFLQKSWERKMGKRVLGFYSACF